jgi:hypothetical protein
MALVRFMSSDSGRLARIVAGAILIGLGAWLGGALWVLAAIGVVPFAAGVFDWCLIAPLFHAPVRHSATGL